MRFPAPSDHSVNTSRRTAAFQLNRCRPKKAGAVRHASGGFALVIALSLMAFILLLLLSISTLSRVELQVSSNYRERFHARQNALLGLQMAVGELQKVAAPDQRVTAKGDLWANPAIGTEHLVGVWNSDASDTANLGRFLRWLVSREDSEVASDIGMVASGLPITVSGNAYTTTSEDFVVMVGEGSVRQDPDNVNSMQGVVAEKVAINRSNGSGHFAWWVGDEGTKATVNQLDPYTTDLANQSSSSWSGLDEQWNLLSQQAVQGTNLGALGDFIGLSMKDTEQVRLMNRLTLLRDLNFVDFTPSTGSKENAIRRRFHSLTTASFGLQTNVRDGGLKRDLSLLFELPEADYYNAILPELTSEDPDLVYTGAPGPQSTLPLLFTEPAPSLGKTIYGPTLDMLRDYYRLYKGVDSRDSSPQLDRDWVGTFFPGKAWYLNNGESREHFAWGQTLNQWAWRKESGIEAPEVNKTIARTDSAFTKSLNGDWSVVRPTRGNYIPYLSRLTLFASVESAPARSGLPDAYDVNVVVQPFIALHNPYNIKLSVPEMRFLNNIQAYDVVVRRGPDPASAPLDPNSDWDLARGFRTGDASKNRSNTSAGNVFESVGAGSNRAESIYLRDDVFTTDGSDPKAFGAGSNPELTCLIPSSVYEPGETKLFVAGDRIEIQGGGRTLQMVDLGQYQPSFGVNLGLDDILSNNSGEGAMWVDHDDDPLTPHQKLLNDIPIGSDIMVKLKGDEWFRFAVEVANLELGRFDTIASYSSYATHSGFYGNNTWNTTLANLDNETPADYADYTHNVELLEGNPTPSVAFDVFLKAMDYQEAIFNDDGSYSGTDLLTTPQLRTFPNFIVSNPLAASFSREGVANRIEFGALGNMFHTSSEKLNRSYANQSDLIQRLNDGDAGTWGRNIGNYGNQNTVLLEIPVTPMQSIGQFQHASLSASQFHPALSIGHSTPSPYVDRFDSVVHDYQERFPLGQSSEELREYVFYDQNYLANEAIWDAYFLSSISPRPLASTFSATTRGSAGDPFSSDLPEVIDDFLSGSEGLPNARIKKAPSTQDEAVVRTELLDFSKSAGHLLVEGSFNINSTSVDAWTAFLSAYREAAILYFRNDSLRTEELDDSSAFLRQSLPGGGAVPPASANINSDDAWSGFIRLTDGDIRELAANVVSEIKRRSAHRGSATAPTPALSIASFVNRILTTDDAFNQTGTLQAAIDASGLNDDLLGNETLFDAAVYRSLNHPGSSAAGEAFSDYPNRDFEVNAALVSPVALTQANILQAIAPAISARSDTFKVRFYGDSTDGFGGTSRAWGEAIVQRVVNHDGGSDPRRFEIMNIRWLNPDEV